MSRAEIIIQELGTWKEKDLRILYDALVSRILRQNVSENSKIQKLDRYIGVGRGVWKTDAQDHVNQLREDRAI